MESVEGESAARTPERPPNNLPSALSSFVGREKEIAEVRRLLEDTRLLTLTGAGGCGKTRLALAAADELVEKFEEGVWMVDLAPLADPSLVPQAVASTFSGSRSQCSCRVKLRRSALAPADFGVPIRSSTAT